MYRDVDVYRGWERSICCSLVIPEKKQNKKQNGLHQNGYNATKSTNEKRSTLKYRSEKRKTK